MKPVVRWLLVGLAAFVAFLVLKLPAAVVQRWLPPSVTLAGLEGTLWQGRASSVAYGPHRLGPVAWDCNRLRILLLQWSCDISWQPPGGALGLHLTRHPRGAIDIRGLQGRVPVATFAGLAAPAGWSGQVAFDGPALRLEDGWPRQLGGRVQVLNLRAPGPGGATLGDFDLELGEGTVGGSGLAGRVADRGGPLRLRATLVLEPDGRYLMQGEVAPGPGASEAIFDTLRFLGPPDGLGRRQFTVEGSL